MEKLIMTFAFLFACPFASHAGTRIPASLNKISFKCASPRTMAGNALSTVEGTLTLKPIPSGAAAGRGLLKVKVGNVLSGDFKFLGQYDDGSKLQPGFGEYYHGGVEINGEMLGLYADFTTPTNGYLEYKGKTYPVECSKN